MVGPFVLPHLCRNIKIFSPLLYALQLFHLWSFPFQKKNRQTVECKSHILSTSFFCLILKHSFGLITYKIPLTEINTQLIFRRNMNLISLNFKTYVHQWLLNKATIHKIFRILEQHKSLNNCFRWLFHFFGIFFWSVKGNYVIEITLMLTPLISYRSNFVGYGESVWTPLYPTKPRLAIREKNILIKVNLTKIKTMFTTFCS